MKNCTTPRTLAECQFTTGYSTAHQRQPWRLSDLLRAVVCVAACVAIGTFIARGSF